MSDRLSSGQSDNLDPMSAPTEHSRRACIQWLAGSMTLAVTAGAEGSDRLATAVGRRQTGPSVFKSRAVTEYAHGLAPFGGCLTSPAIHLLTPQVRRVPWQFDVLVIGSGYGASTIAARLSARRQPTTRIAILERGREWVPGTFPDRLSDVLDESRLKLIGPNKGQINKATGLFNVEQFQELTVLSGSGLGGSSLINASVAIRPDCEVFEQEFWPRSFRSRDSLDPYYDLAELELNARREPLDISHKMYAQRLAGEYWAHCGAYWQPASLTVTRTGATPAVDSPILNRQGMLQRGCIDCGDCLSGCNVGAKNTLTMNYLPLARRSGTEMFTGVEVKYLRKVNQWYEVHFDHHGLQADGSIRTTSGCTTARMVCLGAGSLGSTGILLRSQFHGLRFSPRLGCSWSGNGDALGFVRKTMLPTGVGGYSAYETQRHPIGPTIQSNLTYPHRSLAGRILIQDGAVPRAYASVLGAIMKNRNLDRTQILLGMGHDGAEGRVFLNERGQPEVSWPGLLESPYRQFIRGEFQKVAQAMGGHYEYLRVFGDRMISVHPLGGCGMSDHPSTGVVNDSGQVYEDLSGHIHEGLYVVDGAVLPTSIACNPLLTITAIAERFSHRIVNDPRLSDFFTAKNQAFKSAHC